MNFMHNKHVMSHLFVLYILIVGFIGDVEEYRGKQGSSTGIKAIKRTF